MRYPRMASSRSLLALDEGPGLLRLTFGELHLARASGNDLWAEAKQPRAALFFSQKLHGINL